MSVHGFKVFNPDWTCRKKQYTCPGMFEELGEVEVCGYGMHFCENAADCFNYYNFDPNNKVAEVIAHGEVKKERDKSCTNKLEIVREIPWDEVLRIVNLGKNCTGRCNTGNRNTGDWNTGNWNTGDWNTGDWNKSSFNTGCFNTEEQKILLFNKPSEMTYREWLESDARHLLNQIPKDVVEWVYENSMTDDEKQLTLHTKQLADILKSLMNLNAVRSGGTVYQTITRISSSRSRILTLRFSTCARG